MFPTPKKETKISVWLLAIIFVPVGMALYGLWLFHVEPIYGWTTGLITPIVEGARGIGNMFIPAITDYVTKNPLTVLTASITIGGVIGGKLLQNHYESQKAQLQAEAQQAITNSLTVGQDYRALEQKYATLQEQVKSTQTTDFESLLSERNTVISQQVDTINNLKGQIQSLQDALFLKDTKVVEKTVVK